MIAALTIRATCWCEERIVRIPREWVGERTRSCGASGCRSPVFTEPLVVQKSEPLKISAHAKCGTIDGYLWHLQNGGEGCRPCRLAWGCEGA